jgi:hypothetical protein
MIVGAHYYPWWGRHHSILGGGEWESGVAHQPVLGKYRSDDSAVVRRHIEWSKKAGIDFLAVEWSGQGSWEDKILEEVLIEELDGLRFCIHYDSYLALHKLGTAMSWDLNSRFTFNKTKGEKFEEDMLSCQKYFRHPAYLKIDGRPVLMIYAFREFKNAETYLNELKSKLGEWDPYLIADVVFWSQVSPLELLEAARFKPSLVPRLFWRRTYTKLSNRRMWRCLEEYFSGITGYCLYEPWNTKSFLKRVEKLYRSYCCEAKKRGLEFIPTVMPGYDDRELRGKNRPILERSPEFYQSYWEICQNCSENMIIVTSFNEWHEGTEIEPSLEFGETYLKLTREFGK